MRNNRVQFKFEVKRNITILKGDSATGKTTLIQMIADYQENGSDSGVEIRCDRPCVALSGHDWLDRLNRIEKSIVFVDEGNAFTATHDFAREISQTDNYYVIATRESLFSLPYSVKEVYGIKNDTRQKYQGVTRYYSSFKSLYPGRVHRGNISVPDVVIVEDSGSGFQFFKELCARSSVKCISTQGKANIYRVACGLECERLAIIADGAAFGPEYERLYYLGKTRLLDLFLPESFEWLLLASGLVRGDELPRIMESPGEFIESKDYFSWERFFTALIMRLTKGTYLAYSKSKLNPSYLSDNAVEAVRSVMPDFGV